MRDFPSLCCIWIPFLVGSNVTIRGKKVLLPITKQTEWQIFPVIAPGDKCGGMYQAWPIMLWELGLWPSRSKAQVQCKIITSWGRQDPGARGKCPGVWGPYGRDSILSRLSLSADSGDIPSCWCSVCSNPVPKPCSSIFPLCLWVTRYPFNTLFFLLKLAWDDFCMLSPRNSDCHTCQLCCLQEFVFKIRHQDPHILLKDCCLGK